MKRKTGRRIFVATCGTIGAITVSGLWKLNQFFNDFSQGNIHATTLEENLLFICFPELKNYVPWIPLGNFPTPLMEMSEEMGILQGKLFIKRDDVSSALYGGNKVRKLEYLFAEAKLKSCDTVITIGSIGSNHALTTAILGKMIGFQVELCLFHQPMSAHVEENMRGFLAAGAILHYNEKMAGAYNMARMRSKQLKKQGCKPYFILSGGTCGLGNLGYCGAVLELKAQFDAKNIPYPDALFVPVGTCGTIAGIIAGIKLAGMKTKVFGVKIFDSFPANLFMMKYYAQNVLDCLQEYTGTVLGRIDTEQFTLLENYLGKGYGYPTFRSKEVLKLAEPHLHLENTYTGKTLAACLDYCKKEGKGQNVLFWNTYNSQPFKKSGTFHGMPEQLRPLFGAV